MQLDLCLFICGYKNCYVFLCQGNAVGAVDYLHKFESLVSELGCQFIRRDIFVPSFHEVYPICPVCM